jgi:hypothetical protein
MKRLVTISAFVLLALLGIGQTEPIASLSFSSDSIMIGEQIEMVLDITYSINGDSSEVVWPEIKETVADHIQIIEETKRDTTSLVEIDPYLFKQTAKFLITSFDSGYFAVPPFVFKFNGAEVESNAALLQVMYPLAEVGGELKDIKGIMPINFSLLDFIIFYWYWFAIGLIVLVGFVILFFALKKKPMVSIQLAPTPEVIEPPHVIALRKLSDLERRKLWQQDKVKHYYIELSHIYREYLEKRYKILALEETSDEIVVELSRLGLGRELVREAQNLLILSDLVKFAKEKPLASEHERALVVCREFVSKTKIDAEVSVN